MQRLRITLQGQVQGVGMRPHIYRLATRLGLTGSVYNDVEGIAIEIQGNKAAQFMPELKKCPPALAKINQVVTEPIAVKKNENSFQILSPPIKSAITKIPPDTGICDECLAELFDPESRFYLYPFISCVQCGPRYTVTQQLPYERCHTSYANFPLCSACELDYHDPNNRRYYHQTIACPACGPQLSMPIDEIARHLKQGKIVAVKTLGGYQLIADATQEKTLQQLRHRKQRAEKPFALMSLNLSSAKLWVEIDSTAATVLTTSARPIVLLPRLIKDTDIHSIAPGLSTYGIMLPYTAIHYLIFHALIDGPPGLDWLMMENNIILLVTSGNMHNEPLCYQETTVEPLNKIADYLVSYNRTIVAPVDDSVIKIIAGSPRIIRRARGFSLTEIAMPTALPSILSVGAHLKNTICITRAKEAFLSPHIGDMFHPKTIQHFQQTLSRLCHYLAVNPEYIAHDLHPDFYTSRYAQASGLMTLPVQHHHAHIAAVAAEKNIIPPCLGLALDGYGYGDDGSMWGGELLLYQGKSSQRLAHLPFILQPGGDLATKQPWRMAVSLLHQLGKKEKILARFGHFPALKEVMWQLTHHITQATTSAGRWFDAVSALLGICYQIEYEGQAAMLLESKVTKPEVMTQGWKLNAGKLDLSPMILSLLDCDSITGANLFHGTLANALADWLKYWADKLKLQQIIFSGGCFINRILTETLINHCAILGINVHLPVKAPMNDGGIALGQTWAAALQLMDSDGN